MAEPAPAGTPRYLGGEATGQPAAAPAFLRQQKETGHDPAEAEADRAADQVTETPTPHAAAPTIQRQPGPSGGEAAAPPAAVAQTLAGAGKPMEPQLRGDMEAHFGRDLSAVRLHTDAAAARSAQGIDAQAYASGSHIAFGPGRYAPDTQSGRHLIAHELAHVVQQQGAQPRLQRKPNPKQPAPTTTEAGVVTDADRTEFAREAIKFMRGQADYFTHQPDRPLAEILKPLKTSFQGGLSIARGLASPDVLIQELQTTYTEAVRKVLTSRTLPRPNVTDTPPALHELYEQNIDEILPFALPRHEANPNAGELSAELAAPLPASPTAAQRARHTAITAARQRLKVVTGDVQMEIAPLFDRQGASLTVPVPAGTTVRFASDIPTALHHGLRNTAAQLNGTPLSANTTVMLALDLTRFGGGFDSYRFTRIDLGTTLGNEILIERQGRIGVEGLHTDERTAMTTRFTGFGFVRAGFSTAEFDQVLVGLGQLPDARLGGLRGLTFRRGTASTTAPDASADYDQASHTINVYNRAFPSGGLARQGSGSQPLRLGSSSVVHEIGHALDLAALRTTGNATEAARAAVLAEFGTGGTGFRIPAPGAPDRARFDQLRSAVTTAEAAERTARAISGARWSTGAVSEVTDTLAAGAAQPAFRAAATRDGAAPASGRGFPTTYPNPDSFWQEYFSEAFMLYNTAPDLLLRNRPNVHAFMLATFPR